MKIVLLILGWIVFFALLILSWMFFRNIQLKKSDLVLREGVLQADPEFSRDEFDDYNTRMLLRLEGSSQKIGIPGKLLRQAKSGIEELRAGDQIRYYERPGLAGFPYPKDYKLAYGLGKGELDYYQPEEAIAFYTSMNMWVFAFTFLLGAIVLLYFLVRPYLGT